MRNTDREITTGERRIGPDGDMGNGQRTQKVLSVLKDKISALASGAHRILHCNSDSKSGQMAGMKFLLPPRSKYLRKRTKSPPRSERVKSASSRR
jgi:hypothetical protein